MSLTLLLICRRSINLTQARSLLFHPMTLTSKISCVDYSTLKSKYGSLKPSTSIPSQNPFREPTDEKSRRLKLQEHIRFREKFKLENDYELIYAMPRERMYGFMHLLCTTASITMLVFVVMQFNREMLDMESVSIDINQEIPPWILFSIAATIGSAFGAILFLIARMPVRLYYSPARRSYALFYHPVIGVFRQKKIHFREDQYKLIPQKLDNIESPQRSLKIRIELGQDLLRMKNSFYLVENFFRSRRDIQRVRMNEIKDEEMKTSDINKEQEETDIWETVVEKKDQINPNQQATQRRKFM